MKSQFNDLPYDSRNMEQAGERHPSGIPSKTGKKMGGFTDDNSQRKPKNDKPPRKF